MTRDTIPITFSAAMNRMPMGSFQWITVSICMLILVCDGIDMQLLGILAPLVIEDFGVNRTTFGIAMGAALVGFGIGGWSGGWLGDRIGRRYTLTLSAVVFSLATIGAGSSADVTQLAIWRLLGGIGFGAAYSNAVAMASEWVPDRWRPVVVSTLAVGVPIGGSVVGWIGPDLSAEYGWGGAFVIVGLSTVLVAGVVLAALRDSPTFLLSRGRADLAHKHASLILQGNAQLTPEADVASGSHPISFLDPAFRRLNLGIGIAFASAMLCAFGILSWSTTFLTSAGWSLENAGNTLFVAGLTSMAGSILVGIAMHRFGSRAVMGILSLSLALTFAWLGYEIEQQPVLPGPRDILLVTVLIGAAGAFFSAAVAGMYVIMTHGYPASCRSAGIGFGVFMSRVGAVASSGLGGALLDLGDGSVIPFFATLAVSAIAISTACFIIDRHLPPIRSN